MNKLVEAAETAVAAGVAGSPAPSLSVSLVIPVYNGGDQFGACLQRISELDPRPEECIVVDDGSTDGSRGLAEEAGFRVLSTGACRGPAYARNRGAQEAGGDLLLFLDADVLAPRDIIARVREAFQGDPWLDAVIGSYDDAPAELDFYSQYRNLQHCYVHQTSREEASTFWSGCGAVRREVFLRHGGFRERYARPSVEDIELGLRLHQAGARISLKKDLQVKHLKRWTFWDILRTDIVDRAIPWTLLILRDRQMPAELNLRWRYRFSVALWLGAAAAAGLSAVRAPAAWLGMASATAGILLNAGFYRFLAARCGWWFALRAVPMHALHFVYSGVSFAAGIVCYLLRPKERAT